MNQVVVMCLVVLLVKVADRLQEWVAVFVLLDLFCGGVALVVVAVGESLCLVKVAEV